MSPPQRPLVTPVREYLRVASIYDPLASIYSLGAIDRSRRVHLDHLPPHSHVLYAGGGTGQEAMRAARLGHRVEVWDPSPAMIAKAQRRRAELPPQEQERVRLVQAPAETMPPELQVDALVCNYFLNLFAPPEIPWWLSRLRQQLKPGASLWIADFAPLHGLLTPLQWTHYNLALQCFHWWTGNAKHQPYDYGRWLEQETWSTLVRYPVRMTPWGPRWFACWQAQRRA